MHGASRQSRQYEHTRFLINRPDGNTTNSGQDLPDIGGEDTFRGGVEIPKRPSVDVSFLPIVRYIG